MPTNIVKCKWLESGRIVINPDGQVVPCCFFANRLYTTKIFRAVPEGGILDNYNKAAEELNVFNQPIDKILQHNWFNQLYQSWNDSDKVSKICIKHCSNNK